MPTEEPPQQKRRAFWSTLPGILTSAAALIGAVAALLALFIGGGDDGGQADRQTETLAVPDVVGESEQTAKGLLRGRGLDVSRVSALCSDEPPGTVVEQKPAAGKQVDRAASVALVASSGERRGTITAPKNGATLPKSYKVQGKVCGIPEDSSVWLSVRTDGLYPNAVLVPDNDGRFTQTEKFDDPAAAEGGFSQVLLLVGPSGDRAIRAWQKTSNYASALPRVPGQKILDTVPDLRLRASGR